jgi:hypothetical protein
MVSNEGDLSIPAEVARRYGLDADLAAAVESIHAVAGAVVDR